jgi:hypothetical protein
MILWLCPRIGYKDNQDDWRSPITYFQVTVFYNPGKDYVPVDDAIIEVWQPLILEFYMTISLFVIICIDQIWLLEILRVNP